MAQVERALVVAQKPDSGQLVKPDVSGMSADLHRFGKQSPGSGEPKQMSV